MKKSQHRHKARRDRKRVAPWLRVRRGMYRARVADFMLPGLRLVEGNFTTLPPIWQEWPAAERIVW